MCRAAHFKCMDTTQDLYRGSSYLTSVVRSEVDLWHSMHAAEFLNLMSFSVCGCL